MSSSRQKDVREEKDSLGTVFVPRNRLWGAQTQRSLENFPIGTEQLSRDMIFALGVIKVVAAEVNRSYGLLDDSRAEAMVMAGEEVMEGRWDSEFPLKVWQTGSGTQSNMNANEVIAHRANQLLAEQGKSDLKVHPNDHVNLSQSSNDSFPTAMHLATLKYWQEQLFPSLLQLEQSLENKSKQFSELIKIGRTHTMDATPLTLGQEFSGYTAQIAFAKRRLDEAQAELFELAQGATAVGTGLNSPEGFSKAFADRCAERLGWPLRPARNPFAAIAGHEALLQASSALRGLATSLYKIGNDIRLLASGPRCGLGELSLPANEPGSSIMPGKVNPTQIEALTMVCAQVMGLDAACSFAASQGQFELNAFKPLLVHNVGQASRLLADAIESFRIRCLDGLDANEQRLKQLTEDSLMLVTALSPHIGYDKAAQIAKHAHEHQLSLRQAALELGGLSTEQFDQYVQPKTMIKPFKPAESSST